jgi:hypothetical protein
MYRNAYTFTLCDLERYNFILFQIHRLDHI